jgi:two-component system chemotaxis response regulator CheB
LKLEAAWPLDMARVVGVGASTGGTTALATLLACLPAAHPPLVMVQHMPPGFTASFAQRLDSLSAMNVREARDMDRLVPGTALLAPAGMHLALEKPDSELRLRVFQAEPVHHVIPSVDVLFHSLARFAGEKTVGILLTGMGKDGAQGLLNIRRAGGDTLVQDKASSAVWGMPGAAVQIGAAAQVLPLEQMAPQLLQLLRRKNAKTSA